MLLIYYFVGRCGVLGSTLAFGSIGHVMSWVRIRAPLIFVSWCISLRQAEITGEVLTGRFNSSTAVVHSANCSEERANWVAAYQCCGVNTAEQKSDYYNSRNRARFTMSDRTEWLRKWHTFGECELTKFAFSCIHLAVHPSALQSYEGR